MTKQCWDEILDEFRLYLMKYKFLHYDHYRYVISQNFPTNISIEEG